MQNSSSIVKPFESQFEEVRGIIDLRKCRAFRAVNNENILCNWEVGRYLSEKLRTEKWGKKIVNQLAEYLKKKQPDLKGFDRRALYRMVKFYEVYSSPKFVRISPSHKQVSDNVKIKIVGFNSPQLDEESKILSLLSLINWSSHLNIITGCKLPEERLFYILLCFNEKLLSKELERQIEAGIYERSLLGNNKQSPVMKEKFSTAAKIFKDNYMVDFLNLPDEHNEKSLQKGLVQQMRNFILDLGKDFIFMDYEYPLKVGMSDF